MQRPTRALLRRPPERYANAYAERGIPIDPSLALRQHESYAAALRHAGLATTVLDPDPSYYDSVFVEDTAVLWDGAALITRMTPEREGEQEGIAAVLRGSHTLHRLADGARLEGGDVLHTDTATYVGLTGRTNEAGAVALASFLARSGREAISVPVKDALHLKTACTYLGDGTLLCVPGQVDESRFDVESVLHTAAGEAAAANCLRLGDHLLMADGYPATRRTLNRFAASHGLELVVLDISEFEKGDGSLTCLSSIW